MFDIDLFFFFFNSRPTGLIGCRIDKFETPPEIFAKNIALNIKFLQRETVFFSSDNSGRRVL